MKNRLNVFALGFALGIVWAVAILFIGIMSWLFGWGVDFVNGMGSVYIGYTPTFWGSVIGTIWAFFDCFIAGIIIAWIYNLCSGSDDSI